VLSAEIGSAFEFPWEKETWHKVGEAESSRTTPISRANLKDFTFTPLSWLQDSLSLRSFWMGAIEFDEESEVGPCLNRYLASLPFLYGGFAMFEREKSETVLLR
jgi:hypothetical protein